MLLVTTGGWESHYSPRGINGPIDDILFPIQHGMLFYPGFEVLPPLVIYRTSKTDDEKYAAYCQQLAHRLDTLWQAEPLPFRQQNSGDYVIPALTLREDIAPGEGGFGVHMKS
jgi:NAD(P)H dehydrogenase (quinone)